MHIPARHAETDPTVLRQFIRDNPLGILTTATPDTPHPLLQVSHIPWVLGFEDEQEENANSSTTANSTKSPRLGRLRGHMTRQDPQAEALLFNLPCSSPAYLEQEVLIMFNGPAHHYITPKFYTQTKPATGKVVPTWNYSAVQVYGRARIYHDTQSENVARFLSTQLDDLGRLEGMGILDYGATLGSLAPWQGSDAPEEYIELFTKSLIGIEVEITSLSGRFKWSQDKPPGDRDGMIAGLQNLGSESGL
ncbi:negative transcriptional regulator [Aspergillus sclerotioniger CBS 115572]|uniref:Negative transcriptional regulator n=1 Tax=Aspergillus sclerotioniger CBS 115572 TaxID=1450535 RepID=A0A317WVF9_9EURO|nr:negative transcriptional regulator [Aspergillus sclerotioniger CBS 115572]PWY90346.1 negative transcriptional regulator [Aspergillus sclerotioniger CBS 115572]